MSLRKVRLGRYTWLWIFNDRIRHCNSFIITKPESIRTLCQFIRKLKSQILMAAILNLLLRNFQFSSSLLINNFLKINVSFNLNSNLTIITDLKQLDFWFYRLDKLKCQSDITVDMAFSFDYWQIEIILVEVAKRILRRLLIEVSLYQEKWHWKVWEIKVLENFRKQTRFRFALLDNSLMPIVIKTCSISPIFYSSSHGVNCCCHVSNDILVYDVPI